MAAKINNFSELSNYLDDKDVIAENLFALSKKFFLTQIVHGLGMEKAKGISSSLLILCLLIFRLCGESVRMACMNRLAAIAGASCSKNTYYRLLGDETMNWRGFLMSIAKAFMRIVRENSHDGTDRGEAPACLIFDDTLIEKTGEGNRMEDISRVYDHVTGRPCLGYKLLLCGYHDGKSTIPVDFSICSEKGKNGSYGLRKSVLENRFVKERKEGSHGDVREKENNIPKNTLAHNMLERAYKHGIHPDYVLYDSWFNSHDFIAGIRAAGNGSIHALGMAKNGNQKYTVSGKTYTVKTMIESGVREVRTCEKYRLRYMKVDAMLGDIPVRLFLIKYGRSESWKVLVTTNMRLSFTKAFSIYQIRWNIEVIFRECKQYLGLGRCQSTDFDQQVADSTLVFAIYSMMSVRKRFGEYETMGEVFREHRDELFAQTLWQRMIPVMVKILSRIFSLVEFDIEEAMRKAATDDTFVKDMLCMVKALESGAAETRAA